MKPFVFVDRDDTLVRDVGYTWRLEDYEPLPGAAEGLRALHEAGFGIAIVTNQSGIGRGFYTEADFARFMAHLRADFAGRGAAIDAVYHCPHRPDEGCDCRKPATGMIERARRELDVELERSWVIGDSAADLELARRVGCPAIRIASAPPTRSEPLSAPDLPTAARLILEPHRPTR